MICSVASAAFVYALLADSRAAQLQTQSTQVNATIRNLQKSISELQRQIEEYEEQLDNARETDGDIQASLRVATKRVAYVLL